MKGKLREETYTNKGRNCKRWSVRYETKEVGLGRETRWKLFLPSEFYICSLQDLKAKGLAKILNDGFTGWQQEK